LKVEIDTDILVEEIEKEISILRKENKDLGRKNLNEAYARNTMCLVGMYRVLDIITDLKHKAICSNIDNYVEKQTKDVLDSEAV